MIHADFKCEFYFIRHGESVSNATPGLAAGLDYDAPLTEKGFSQARLVGSRLKRQGFAFDRVYGSSLARVDQTSRAALDAALAMGGPWPAGTPARRIPPDRLA